MIFYKNWLELIDINFIDKDVNIIENKVFITKSFLNLIAFLNIKYPVFSFGDDFEVIKQHKQINNSLFSFLRYMKGSFREEKLMEMKIFDIFILLNNFNKFIEEENKNLKK